MRVLLALASVAAGGTRWRLRCASAGGSAAAWSAYELRIQSAVRAAPASTEPAERSWRWAGCGRDEARPQMGVDSSWNPRVNPFFSFKVALTVCFRRSAAARPSAYQDSRLPSSAAPTWMSRAGEKGSTGDDGFPRRQDMQSTASRTDTAYSNTPLIHSYLIASHCEGISKNHVALRKCGCIFKLDSSSFALEPFLDFSCRSPTAVLPWTATRRRAGGVARWARSRRARRACSSTSTGWRPRRCASSPSRTAARSSSWTAGSAGDRAEHGATRLDDVKFVCRYTHRSTPIHQPCRHLGSGL